MTIKPNNLKSGKNIILLFDGTGNDPGENKTNVIKTAELLANNAEEQIIFYDPGVGTLNSIGTFARPLRNKIGRLLGKAFGYGVKKNILEGYSFLMHNFKKNDRVYIFGFSRGAFTARKLADLLTKYGLLNKKNDNLFPYLLKSYFSKKDPDCFWQNICKKCTPHFIGVWDTVESLGYFLGKKFFNHNLNSEIKYACHAVAIDERRKHFSPWLWDTDNIEKDQKIMQVYFIGCHSDVGGWHKKDGLSDITLKWMLLNAEHVGIQLNNNWKENLRPNPAGKIHSSKNFRWMWAEIIDAKKWKQRDLREIPKNSKVHLSVKERKNYKPENLDFNQVEFNEYIFEEQNDVG